MDLTGWTYRTSWRQCPFPTSKLGQRCDTSNGGWILSCDMSSTGRKEQCSMGNACTQQTPVGGFPFHVLLALTPNCSFERVSCCQLLGFVIRETLHAQEEEAKTPGKGEAPRIPKVGNWILAHDPEQYAYENFGTAFNHLVSGAPFKNTNIPPGYVHVPWTMADLSKQAAAGKSLASSLSGDWS